jgi:S1-C subfamily serine protease
MNEQQSGVLVSRVLPLSNAAQVLLPDDVLLSVDGVDIANDGLYQSE